MVATCLRKPSARALLYASAIFWSLCIHAQQAPTVTTEKQIETVELVCVPPGGTVPPEYREVAFGATTNLPGRTMCKCDSNTPYSKEVLGAISIGGAYKLLKFTHDTTPKIVADELKRFELPSSTVKRISPRIAKVATSKPARVGSLVALIGTVIFVSEEVIADHVAERLEKNETDFQLKPYAAEPSSRGIYAAKDLSNPSCSTAAKMSLKIAVD